RLAVVATIVPGSRLAISACRDAMTPKTRCDFPANCERPATPGLTTLRVLLFSVLAACGGGSGHKQDTYARATDAQQTCCEHLQGDPRASCLQQIVRVEDFAQKSSVNQSTYGCVVDHFTCDPATGHATKDSAQAQIDCIQDLQ